jgi:hypothetical protein
MEREPYSREKNLSRVEAVRKNLIENPPPAESDCITQTCVNTRRDMKELYESQMSPSNKQLENKVMSAMRQRYHEIWDPYNPTMVGETQIRSTGKPYTMFEGNPLLNRNTKKAKVGGTKPASLRKRSLTPRRVNSLRRMEIDAFLRNLPKSPSYKEMVRHYKNRLKGNVAYAATPTNKNIPRSFTNKRKHPCSSCTITRKRKRL